MSIQTKTSLTICTMRMHTMNTLTIYTSILSTRTMEMYMLKMNTMTKYTTKIIMILSTIYS